METLLKNIVMVPTDFSEVCANAMNQAAEAAKILKFKVVLLHVIDSNTKTLLKKEEKNASWIEEKLEVLAKELGKETGVPTAYIAKEGNIFETIPEVASEIGASLIFLGTHGKVGMQKLTGSYALKVITSSPVPVIVVQKRHVEGGIKNIVLPLTSDAGPWEKTKWASHISKQFNAKIDIFQMPGDESLEETVHVITRYFEENNVAFSVTIAEKSGNFTKQVIDHATSVNAGMIMIMTNPDKGFKEFLLGSYDEELIFNTSQIPVMCINPRDVNWKKIVVY